MVLHVSLSPVLQNPVPKKVDVDRKRRHAFVYKFLCAVEDGKPIA